MTDQMTDMIQTEGHVTLQVVEGHDVFLKVNVSHFNP